MLQNPRWSHGCPAETPGETHSAEGGVSDLVQNVPHILGRLRKHVYNVIV